MVTRVKTSLIEDAAVTSSKIATDAVGAGQIGADAVAASELANNAVDTNAIQDSAVTAGKIGALAVTTAKLDAGAVTTAKIADDAITSDKLGDAAVLAINIASNSVGGDAIIAGSIVTSHLAAGAVNSTALADESITTQKIPALAVTLAKIANGANNAVMIRNGSGALNELAPGANGTVLTMAAGAPTWVTQPIPTGMLMDYFGTGSPTGWLQCSGETIGNASSGATALADTLAQNLFVHLWNNFPNSVLAVSGGRGSTALSDYAANKTIALPDLRGRTTVCYEFDATSLSGRITTTGSGASSVTSPGIAGGTETVTLISANMPPHQHFMFTAPVSIPNNYTEGTANSSAALRWILSQVGGTWDGGQGVNAVHDQLYGSLLNTSFIAPTYGQTSITGGSGGNATAHGNMSPFMLVGKVIKL